MELDFETFTPADLASVDASTDPERWARTLGWFQASQRGFHLKRLDEAALVAWLERSRVDGATLRGAWLPSGSFGAEPMPVATVSSWPGEVNTGAAMLGLHMVSDVTVAPSHRRRGLARRLLVEDLVAGARAGLPLAGLTVSEGSIYRRFGFGPATFTASHRVDVTGRFALQHPDAVGGTGRQGRVVQREPDDVWDVVRDVFARWNAATRGSVTRHAAYEAISRGLLSPGSGGPDDRLRAAVHLDADERPDGYVLFRHAGFGETPRAITVTDVVALGPSAHLGLWEYLAGFDLTDEVRISGHLDDPLRWALVDPRCVEQTGVEDHLWVRPLDLPAAVAGRPWFGEGRIRVGVQDPLGLVDGTWEVTAAGGRARAVATALEPEVTLGCEAFGSLYLGAVDVRTLAMAGRVRGSEEALERFASLTDGGERPFCRTAF